MPLRYGHTLSGSRLDFENLTQSEAREPPTSGHKSAMGVPTMVLIVFIALYDTYTLAKHHYLRNRMTAYHLLMAQHCQTASRFDFENLTQSEARELPTIVDTQVWWSALESC